MKIATAGNGYVAKQLPANAQAVPQRPIRAVVDSNRTREDFAAAGILPCKPDEIEVIVVNRMSAAWANFDAMAFARDVFGTD